MEMNEQRVRERGERENALQSPSEDPCCTAQMRVHPNFESALAESQARVRSLLYSINHEVGR